MYCIKCGTKNVDGATYCIKCGQPINNSNSNQQSINDQIENSVKITNNRPLNNQNDNFYNKNQQKGFDWKILVIVVLIAVAGFFGAKYCIQQYRLHKVDKEIQDEAQHINDSFNQGFNVNSNEDEIKKYNIGENVTLVDGSTWYVMNQNDSLITLISTSNYGEQTYFSQTSNYYENSIVKEIIENEYLPSLKASVEKNNGDVSNLSARIISVNDIRNIMGISSSTKATDISIDSSYKWLFETGNCWTSTHSETSGFEAVYVINSWGSFASISEDVAGLGLNSGNKFYIRPVIETNIKNIK